ncbi:hypothetical protein AAC387_Pa11g1011 [Persea americana]
MEKDITDAHTVERDLKVEQEEDSKLLPISYDAKLRELLRNLCSLELKIYSEASKEFIRIIRRGLGGEFLRHYVQASPSCMELMEVWKLQQGKAGMAHIVLLISEILDHPDGKYCMDDIGRLAISRRLDKLAQLIIDKKMQDVYTELNSREAKRQRAVLLLMAAIVRRGVGLASEVTKIFDFKLAVFPKLAEIHQKKGGKKLKHSTRPSFIKYAMAFLEVGNPRLLRWILQQRDMYFSVLRGLGSDDDATVNHVLTTLQDKVLSLDSLVPPSLRSVLFGSVTLEQLSNISGNSMGGPSAELAHEILVTVCTDPCNGLMPDLKDHMNPLRGNPKRLLELMKKLKVTEVKYHRDLLLALVSGSPSLGSAYMDEFPYILEPRASPLWFSAISLATDLISSAKAHMSITSLGLQSNHPPPLDDPDIQCMLKCIIPRSFTRLVINRGLLHSDIFVKHGSLRLLLEALKSFDKVIVVIDDVVEKMTVKQHTTVFHVGLPKFNGLLGIDELVENVDKCPKTNKVGDSCMGNSIIQKWMHFKQEIQNEVRALLPDPQVILKLLSSLCCDHHKNLKRNLKRERTSEDISESRHRDDIKKLKSDTSKDNVDIVLGGIIAGHDTSLHENYGKDKGTYFTEEGDPENDNLTVLARIWDSHEFPASGNDRKDAEIYLHSKLLDVLTFYLRTMPFGLEGSFDIFKMLPSNPLIIPVSQQQSLLSLLMVYIGQSCGSRFPVRGPELMYKHLQPIVDLFIHSSIKGVQDQAYVLAKTAMFSTGAFDGNPSEIDVWFSFLPGYSRDKSSLESEGSEVFRDLSRVVISFFCDAVSTMGNNLYKYLDNMRSLSSKLQGIEDISLDFSPLVVCILRKCLRLLDSDSGTFELSEKAMISLYICNTLSLLLQTQVDGLALSGLIEYILTEKFRDFSLENDDSAGFPCEWRPLKKLLQFAQSIIHQQARYGLCSDAERVTNGRCCSLLETLGEVKKMIGSAHGDQSAEVVAAFLSALICASPDGVLENFSLLITVARLVFGAHFSFLSSIFFLERNLLVNAADLWPDMFFSGLEMVGTSISDNQKDEQFLSHDMGDSDSSVADKSSRKDIDSMESVTIAFGFLLNQAPFYVLLPAITCFGSSELLGSSKIIDLLKAKLSKCSEYDSIISLRLVLFWVHQVQSTYRAEPSSELGQMLQAFLILIEHIFSHLMGTTAFDSGNAIGPTVMPTFVQELSKIFLHHPVVTKSLLHPFCLSEELTSNNVGDIPEDFLTSSKHSVHPVDHHILNLIKRVGDYLLAVGNSHSSFRIVNDTVYKSAVNTFRQLVQWVVLLFKDKFELCIMDDDAPSLLPIFYALHALLHFISPFELLELMHWMFCKFDLNLMSRKSSRLCALTIGFYIADGAFDILSCYLHQRKTEAAAFHLFSEMEVVSAANREKSMPAQTALLPLNMVLLRMVTRSPRKMLTYLIDRTSKLRAEILFQLTEVSPMHLSLFGQIFLRILNKDVSYLDVENTASSVELKKMFGSKCCHAFSDEEFIMLLPAALSYLTSCSIKFSKQYLKSFESIPLCYSRILLDGFSNWKRYISQDIFQENYNEFTPTSMEELDGLFTSSLLGKAVCMLQYYFMLNGNSINSKKRLKIFYSMYACSGVHDELLDCDVREISIHSFKELLNLINRIVAKITVTRMLLFPQDNSFQFLPTETDESTIDLTPLETKSRKIDFARLKFTNILVYALDKIVKRHTCIENSTVSDNAVCCQFLRFLEVHILRNIVQISTRIQNYLIQLNPIPFLEPFIHSSFRHRFEDPTRLKALRVILCSLAEGMFSSCSVLELVLAHSQFVSTILWNDSTPDSAGLSEAGTLLRPMSSLLKVLDLPYTVLSGTDGKSIREASTALRYKHFDAYNRKLELVKLLRVLYHLKALHGITDPGKDLGLKSRELLSLLLSGYGATLSETDLEIFHLMNEIESDEGLDSGSIAEMDYLWGTSALKIRREQTLKKFILSNDMVDGETAEEWRKRQFRETLPVDPKLCAMTALHFFCERTSSLGHVSLMKVKQDAFMDLPKQDPCCGAEKIQCYDPAFILPFSIHSLLMGYIDPVEFAGIGLLAISFVSLSSRDEGIRKLGYEALGRFKKALESYQNRKDGLRLRLLLTYLQNGISEPWQKVPSLITIFAAEASLILLDPSHDHYLTVSKFLMHSPSVDLKSVPLFHSLFGSSSIHFKTDRLWILCLLYAALNFDDNGQIFIRKHLLELLMSFYTSPLSDYEAKILILQMVKKSVKLHILARHLVERCGLFSWLFSVLSFCGKELHGAHKEFYLKQISLGLQVANDVISSRNITEWLQKYKLEELSELSSYLFMIFVNDLKLAKDNPALADSILHLLFSTLRISQKRKIYQPHFTFSVDGLLQLHQAIDEKFNKGSFGITAEIGLKIILMSTPLADIFDSDGGKLLPLVMWAVAMAQQACATQTCWCKESCLHSESVLEEQECEDSLISKLLRWLIASVILQKISSKTVRSSSVSPAISSTDTLQTLLEHIKISQGQSRANDYYSSAEALAVIILHLGNLLGMYYSVLPSVISALCLLLPNVFDSTDPKENCCSSQIASLCSKIRCPVEANPAWRWSYYQPWKDRSLELTDLQKMEEHHACQSLLVIFSNALQLQLNAQ